MCSSFALLFFAKTKLSKYMSSFFGKIDITRPMQLKNEKNNNDIPLDNIFLFSYIFL